jgi:RNA polymerase sigma factor (sigma-70 family)
MAIPTSNVAQLVLACRTCGAEAFTPLVRRYQHAAYATALSYVRNAQDAQDIVQDAFIAAYCKLEQLRDPAKFGSWFFRIVNSRCTDLIRSRKQVDEHVQRLEKSEIGLAQRAHTAFAEQALLQEVWDSIDRLPEQYRQVVLLHYLSGLSYEEIAAFLEVPKSTVVGRLQQSRKRLRQTLSETALEKIEKTQVDISEEVQAVICQIETKKIRQVVPLRDTRNIVIYCGIDVDVEVRQASGNDVVLEGTQAAVGLTKQQAGESLSKIAVKADRVEDYLDSGPHEGEVFRGTYVDDDGSLTSMSQTSTETWINYLSGKNNEIGDIIPAERYPFLKEHAHSLPEEVRKALKNTMRISVVKSEMEDLDLPGEGYTPDLQRVFRPTNLTYRGRVMGPVGYVNLVIGVPPDTHLTIFGGQHVQMANLHGSVSLMKGSVDEVSAIEGSVYLLDTPCAMAHHIREKFYQRFHTYGQATWSSAHISRAAEFTSVLEHIEGEIDIDVGKVDIQATDLAGAVAIHNRHGKTRLAIKRFPEEDRCHITSLSGSVELELGEALSERLKVFASTLCGAVRFDDLKEFHTTKASTSQLICFSSMLLPGKPGAEDIENAAVSIQTESGDINVSKMKEESPE